MRIISFRAGLGNQIFGYAFCKYLQKQFPSEKIYGVYWKRDLKEHNGLEIDKWFDAELPPKNFLSSIVTFSLRCFRKIGLFEKYYDGGTRSIEKPDAILFESFKMNKLYIPKADWIHFKIKEKDLSVKNKEILTLIRKNNSFFIHIRRGDYLSSHYSKTFANVCGVEYYSKAISTVLNYCPNVLFFAFSDDIEWVKNNIAMENVYYIDWNTGVNSVLDMFLMSECKGGIMANSSFSFWGAKLGRNKDMVIYPKKWDNLNRSAPDIFEDDWISI